MNVIDSQIKYDWIQVPQTFFSNEFKQHIEGLLKIIDAHLLRNPVETEDEWKKILSSQLPLASCNLLNEDVGIVNVEFISLEFPSLETRQFIYKLFERYILGKYGCTILACRGYSFEQTIPDMPRLVVSQYLIEMKEGKSFLKFQEDFGTLEQQLKLAAEKKNFSFYLASSHLNSHDNNVITIQRALVQYALELGEELDHETFVEVDRWLIAFPSDFFGKRDPSFLAKAFFTLIKMRKELEWSEAMDSNKGRSQLHLFPSYLNFTFGTKPVLACVLGMHLNPNSERFKEKHLKAALKSILSIADLSTKPYSLLSESNVQVLYVEFEKQDGAYFSDDEIEQLKARLPQEVEARVQHFVPELFMVRNEEEIMKSILTLTQEIATPNDLPQVMIRYEKHDEESLVFCVILVRILKPDSLALEEAFSHLDHSVILIPERTQIVSYLEEKFPIEANVFRIQLSDLAPFQRRNFSFNFFEARTYIGELIEKAYGEIRDYNGGMILKQSENLERFKKIFSSLEKPELLEKFFYSLNPIEIQALIPTETLKNFFLTFCKLLELNEEKLFAYQFSKQGSQLFLFIKGNDQFKSYFETKLHEKNLKSELSISSSLFHYGFRFEGMIFDTDIPLNELQKELERILKFYLQHQVKPKVLTLNLEYDIFLDPRQGGDYYSSTIVKILFEGLMRLGEDGIPRFACAEKVDISSDHKRYTFTLRECYWSNGMKVIAEDFEYAWKKVISPGFNTRFSYLFYFIKNAREANKGLCSLNEVGVKALDEKRLQIDLVTPAQYFLEVTTLGIYSPVNSRIDQIHPNWAQERNEKFICNGPFKVRHNRSFYFYEFERNNQYWNANQIKLDYMLISKVKRRQGIELFRNNKIEWLGPPLGHSLGSHSELSKLNHYVGKANCLKSFWFCFNSQLFPFDNKKIRAAFSLAINRSEIIGENKDYLLPAYSPLPLIHTQLFKNHDGGLKEDIKLAKQLLLEGLKEQKLSINDFPQVSIIHYNTEVSSYASLSIKQQWEEVLGIRCRIEPYEFSDLFERLASGDFQISCFCWSPWINDPIYTLNVYRNKNEKMNFFGWENKEYQKLLTAADLEKNVEKRLELLSQAETILRNEYFILPIFHEYERFLKQKHLHVPVIKDLFFVDYAYSYFKD